uniref:Uncharacterized protein n=1 Tax=Nicotiana tabacum TaxID=4097 RepID=A0A1S3XYP4_TOBAC|nr:PREDICTED: uncharacterized protein LOC107770200 [Nicotiana tabacum]
MELVQEVWDTQISGNAMWILLQKLKMLTKKLSEWSRNDIGNIYDQVVDWEAKVQMIEDLELIDNSEQVREELNKAHAELSDLQKEITTPNIFIALLKILQIYRIKNSKGIWIQGDEKNGNSAIRHFKKLFNLKKPKLNETVLDVIPTLITEEDNDMLSTIPDEEEIMLHLIESPANFSKLRPISLTNFSSKIISKSGFVKGRLITDNVLLAQEIIQGISQPNVGGNIVIKLDMAKAYNRIGPKISYLAYADDIIIFSGGKSDYIKLIMSQIKKYENCSGKLVNGQKSVFLTSPKASTCRINRIRSITGFLDKPFPFTYLGCPLFIGRKKISIFDDMISKVVKILREWQGKLLSHGERIILIKYILQAIPTYTQAAMCPPKGTFKLMEKYFSRFFWCASTERIKFHWSSWDNLCFPIDEGGVGIRNQEDIYNTLAIKRWWNFKTQQFSKPSIALGVTL